jgi:pimeloyl-ACP methyl ester carboxylesterase
MPKFLSACVILSFFVSSNVCSAAYDSVKAPADTAHFYTAPDGVKIYYETHGSGYPVVLLHGFMGNAQGWKKGILYSNLLAAGYQVILVDLRGNGNSGKPPTCEAKDVMGVITALGIYRYTVLGYSRGSIITARLLVLDERVEQAVIGGMGTGFTDPNWPRRVMFYRALSGEKVPELADMVKNAKAAGLEIGVLACQQKEQPSTSKADLGKVRKRVLVVCGDKDSDNGNAKDLADIFTLSSFVLVPGDHGAAVRTPEFSKAVLDWLKG